MGKADGSKVTTRSWLEAKAEGRPITMLTAYDYPTAHYFDLAGIDALLVGDSLGMVVYGQPSTLGVRIEDLIRPAQAVVRAAQRAMVIVDLPFLTYQVSEEEALRSAGRILSETGAAAVKLEGGLAILPAVKRLVEVGIPVLGHLGLTPQSVHALGGFRVQGREEEAADRILLEAKALEEAGAFGVVLEAIPVELARRVTGSLRIPTIGIGAGPHCDGQVLVGHDMLGLGPGPRAKFVRTYADLGREIQAAAERFASEVRGRSFPGDEESYR